MILALTVFITASLLEVSSLPFASDSMEDNFAQEEFDYFYNLELVEKLELVRDDTQLTNEDVNRIVNDEDDSPGMDEILDKMLLQGSLLEEVLNELSVPQRNTDLKESSDLATDFSSSLLYEILYWLFLACFIVMLLTSVLMTAKYILDNPRHGITVNTNKDSKTAKDYPWELTFKNLMMEDEYQFELKHSNSGYVWILPGTKVTHMTDHSHRFDLRNKTHAVIATVEIENPKSEL